VSANALPTSAPPPPAPEKPAELHLSVGTVLNLQNLSDRSGTRLQAKVLGFLEGLSILAVMPGGALLPVDLRAGDEIAVRYLMGRSVCGFRTNVLRVCTLPFPYFHLEYPKEVQRMDVRRAERVQVALPGRVELGAGPVQVQIRDLSATGAMLSAPQELGQVDGMVNVSFELTFGEVTRQLATGAAIRNAAPPSKAEAGGQVFRYGVQFQDLSEDDRIFVRGFVFEQLASRGSVTALFTPGG
jgi:c-di-GMP-binding flagellar brake protein YcgR